MNFNLALILTVLTAFTGVVVAINKFIWQRADRWKTASRPRQTLVEYCQSFFPVLLFVLIIRSFVFEPFRIPSGSMEPTLEPGDFIFVEKFSYGLRLPVTETKVLETGEPQRGDVVVFRLPADPSINYIKRVVGLPGDVIEYNAHRLTVNGETMKVDPPITARSPSGSIHQEQLFSRRHDIKILVPGGRENGRYVVPEGHYFMMGDNRDNSTDSRFHQVGPIPERFLVGKATRIWMHIEGLSWPDWGRIGTKIE
ncbi:MAG TPA: signal peptidase I [Woeseiaceae bacterium]|nr:signal peptidase I [Woeseiaceae bacterium]